MPASPWQVTVDPTQRARIQKNLDPALYAKEIDDAARRLATAIQRRAKQIVPVRTGRLKRSIEVDRGTGIVKTGWVVVARAPYAKFVHDGTIHMRARPFIKDAAADVNRNAQDELKATVRNIEKRWEGSGGDLPSAVGVALRG